MEHRLLSVIDGRDESFAAFQLLKDSLRKDAQIFPDHLIGWQGGSRRHTTYWLPDVGIWAVLERSPPDSKNGPRHRFWNCFGTQNPAERAMLTITVEINPPHEGENRHVAGLFGRDEAGRVYIAHTGKVGGGRAGIGMKTFRKFFGDDRWSEIETRGGLRSVVVLGPIDGPDFVAQLSDFVHKVAGFKQWVGENPIAAERELA